MYTLFIQKNEGDTSPFYLTSVINDFLVHSKGTGFIVSPGYLSRVGKFKLPSPKIDILLDMVLNGSNIQSFGILNAMHHSSISDFYAEVKLKYPTINLIDFDRNLKSDHRKMIFIYEDLNIHLSSDNYTTKLNMDDYIKNINVIGVFIGSSNFSYQTYVGNSSKIPKADKGEADIMLFFDDKFAEKLIELIDNPYREIDTKIVLSKSITDVNVDYLNQIFRSVLDEALL